MVKRVTIWYADDLSTFDEDKWKNHRQCFETYFMSQPMSKRLDWVKQLLISTYKMDEELVVITNDYAFIRLLEAYTPDGDFCIYQADCDCFVNEFVDLKPNPTLTLDEFLYKIAVKKALKQWNPDLV